VTQVARIIITCEALALALSLSGPAQAQEGDAMAQAEAHHQRGIQLFQAGSYREAAGEFEQAESLVHSRANLMNLARCHQQLGENGRARGYIDRYLAEPDLPAESRTRAEGIRQELTAGGGGGGGGGGNLAGPWAVLGSGLALLVTGGVLDIVAYSRSSTGHGADDPFSTQDEYEDWRDGATNIAVAGDVLVAVGAAAAVAGLIWLLVARRSRSGEASTARRLALLPMGNGGVMLRLGAWGSP